MTVREIVAWVLSGGGAVGVGAAIPLAVRAFNQARLVGSLPPTPIGELEQGLQEVSGALRVPTARTAPVTGRSCVWYRLLVEQQRGNRWQPLLDVTAGDAGVLEQDGAVARIDLREADVAVFASGRVRTGSMPAPSEELEAAVAKIPGAQLADTPEGPFVRWREEVLCDGETVYAVATARREEDRSWSLVREEKQLLGVFDHDSTEVVRYLRRTGRSWVLTALVSLGVMAWGLWMVSPELLGGTAPRAPVEMAGPPRGGAMAPPLPTEPGGTAPSTAGSAAPLSGGGASVPAAPPASGSGSPEAGSAPASSGAGDAPASGAAPAAP